MRHILAQLTVLAMLVPVLSLALSCRMSAASNMNAMACCRKMHSTCMQGEQAGSLACCHRVQPKSPAVLTAAAAESTVAAPVLLIDIPAQPALGSRQLASGTAPSPPGSHASLTAVLRV